MDRQGELASHRSVTGITKIRLSRLDQASLKPTDLVGMARNLEELFLRHLRVAATVILNLVYKVARVTIAAGQTACHMRRMEVRVRLFAALVTREATLRLLFRVSSEGKNQLIRRQRFRFIARRRLLPLDVRFTGTMASLTGHRRTTRGQSGVRRLVELNKLRPVTRSARIVTD